MNGTRQAAIALGVFLVLGAFAAGMVVANGGPFVIKYPNGDPAAKGVLARLDPDLKPARETRLRVVKEDLSIKFTWSERFVQPKVEPPLPPLAHVSAAYTIENPTDQEIEVEFGFPILRGIYISPYAMVPIPDARIMIDQEATQPRIISNSSIYGIIRQRARKTIDAAVAADPMLSNLVAAVRNSSSADREGARAKLAAHLTNLMKWNERDAALMVEYAGMDFDGPSRYFARDRSPFGWEYMPGGMRKPGDPQSEHIRLIGANLGPLALIGEQKATQFFAQIASTFDPSASATYEAIFSAWGGDVRERSVDFQTGAIRPREISVDPNARQTPSHVAAEGSDPTVYARVDYLEERSGVSDAEKAACRNVLKNLPVVFTFAPMNLLYYPVKFPPRTTRTVTVTYSQFAFADTRLPSSYQLAYVVHPASLWNQFGPINLEVAVPEGVPFRASLACKNGGTEEREAPNVTGIGPNPKKARFDIYRGNVTEKTGEILLAVDAEAFKRAMKKGLAPAAQASNR